MPIHRGDSSAAWFPPDRQAALADFWEVYDRNYDAMQVATMHLALAHPEFGPLIKMMKPEDLAAQSKDSRERLRRAIAGDWTTYETDLRVQGAMYAKMGLSFAGWYDLVRMVHAELVPLLVAEFGAEPARLSGALQALHDFMDRAMLVIGEEYLGTKEKLLLESEARNAAVISASLDAIICMDAHGIIREFNPAAEKAFGYTRAQAVGQRLDELIIPSELRDQHRQGLAQYLKSGEGPVIGKRLEVPALRADNSQFHVEVAIVPTSTDEGGIMFTGFLRDISERKRAEEMKQRSVELEAQNMRIQEASRLKSEFLANMSHELRTPLNSIIGFAEVLHDGEVDPASPEHREFLGDILRSGRHLLQLINDVLDLSKIEAGKLEFHPEELSLGPLVGEVVAILRSVAAAKHIRVQLDVDTSLTELSLDPARLKQLLYNYLSNALKFTPERGTVTVRAMPFGADALRIEVEDTGIGIAPADLERLFVEFQQLDAGAAKKHGGTGLGLALTKRLVEAQGGSVGVRSTVGEGSVFHATLPRRVVGGAPLPEPRVIAGAHSEAPRVLVVEDDPADQAIIVHALTMAGYAVETSATGAQALAACRDKRFDAITLDLLLPDMNGLEVLAEVRRHGHTCPVIVCTVVAEQSVAGVAVDDILIKPVDEDVLVAALRRHGVSPEEPGPVLVVDDDAASLRLMEVTLTRLGYRVLSRPNGASALAAVEGERPSAVVLDLLMPEMDGFEFLLRFRATEQHQSIPVLVWTVKDLTTDEHARLRASAQAVLLKGRDGTAALVDALEQLLPAGAQTGAAHGA